MPNRRKRGQLIPRGDRTGARVYLNGSSEWLGTYDTADDAQAAIDQAVRDQKAPSRETVDSFAERWVRDYPRPRVSTNSTNGYRADGIRKAKAVKVDRRIVTLARLPMADVTRPIARAFAMANPNLLGGCRAMFGDAHNDGIVTDNPFSKLRLPQSRGRADVKPLSAEEVEVLADTAHDLYLTRRPEYQFFAPMIRALILTAAYTGIRPGELFGLEWADVDFDNEELQIERRVWRNNIDLPKTGRKRPVIVPEPALRALTALPRGRGRIFTTKQGRPLKQTNFVYYWHKIRIAFEAKLPTERRRELEESRTDGGSMDFYEARHFCASWMLDHGATLEEVARQLGHTTTDLVERTYGHPNESLARERLRRQLRGNVRDLRAVEEETGS